MTASKVIILGGDLWGGLLAYHIHKINPSLDFDIYESSENFGRHHSWTFLESDISPTMTKWLKPFITQSWDNFTVKFPMYKREIHSRCHMITSKQLHDVLMRELPADKIKLGTTLTVEEAVKKSKFVLDTRGTFLPGNSGYKKHVGLEVRLKKPHELTAPILMDATVNQMDGYRSLQYFPMSERSVFIEDTRYSDSPHLDVNEIKSALERIISSKEWEIEQVTRVEEGIVPLPLEKLIVTDYKKVINLTGLFHDTTGCSLPMLMKFIDDINEDSFEEVTLRLKVDQFRKSLEKQRAFFRTFNKLIFKLSPPHERYLLWQHFYHLPLPLIERFHGGKLRTWDKARLFLGKPTVPMVKAMKTLWPSLESRL